MSSLDITYDLDDISKNSQQFVDKFHFLTIIKEGEKPYINSDESIIIDTSHPYLQGISRWVFNQKRENMYNTINKLLDSYIIFLQLLNVIVNERDFNIKQKTLIANIVSMHNENSQKIIQGLQNLTKTYNDYTEFIALIDNYITKLNSYRL